MNIKKNITNVRLTLPEGVQLIVVSKTQSNENIQEAYHGGQRIFGENKVQELVLKHESLPSDIEWHMIGHLQSNKVKYIAPFVSLIHSIDSYKLLKEVDKQASKNKRQIKCLLQMHIATEETKFGLSEEELISMLATIGELQHVQIIGLMGMATFTDNTSKVKAEFGTLKTIFEKLKSMNLPKNMVMKELSMGMSGDYAMAIEEGSTMVRIGSSIFGAR